MNAWRHRLILALLGVIVSFCAAGVAHGAETRALITSGLGGNGDYETEFQRHAKRIFKQLSEVGDDVTLLLGETADAQAVRAAVDGLVRRAQAVDALIFVYVGHGTYNSEAFKFNVPGPDFTATELASWLQPAAAEHQLVVVTGASSGAVQEVLAADGRTVISGTRSGEQRNATVFGRYFSAALEDDEADVDKDQRITAAEAFHYAESGIDAYYSGNHEMTTENPVVSGPEPVMVLAHLQALATVNAELAHLVRRREALELDVAVLRENKPNYSTDDYFAELQRLLLELAVIEAQMSGSQDGPQ